MNRKLFFIALGILSVSYLGCDNNAETITTCTPGCLDGYMRVTCTDDGKEIMEMCDHGCQNGQCFQPDTPEKPDNPNDTPNDPPDVDSNGDVDRDGILNGIESDTCLDLKSADTDNDGIKDGDEDLNRNGLYEPLLGETNPCDAASKLENDELSVRKLACDAPTMLSGKTMESQAFSLVKFDNAEYKDTDDYVAFRHHELPVVGFYGTADAFNIDDILANSLVNQKYLKEYTYINAIPRMDWIKNGVFDTALQGLPNHVIDRYKITIEMEGIQTLETLQEMFMNTIFGEIVVLNTNDMERCDSGTQRQAILYLARSAYSGKNGNVYLYSGALTCRDQINDNDTPALQVRNILDDTISGNMTAPKGISDVARYAAFDQFVCQGEHFSTAQNAVDFLWVIDNSGSMGDELSMLADTVDHVAKRLDSTGIDYRFAVTTTDAYLIDEQGTFDDNKYSYDTKSDQTYQPYHLTTYHPLINAYINGLGIRTTQHKHPCMLGRDHLDVLKDNIEKYSAHDTGFCPENLNICGKGYEDGFKSGAITLERLSLNVDDPKPNAFSQEWWDQFVQIKKHTAYQHYFDDTLCKDNELETRCQELLSACQMRPNALKYIIFVSDEDSRQFKEDAIISPHTTHLNGCLTGYKLEVTDTEDIYSMITGTYANGMACNPSLKDYKKRLSAVLKDGETLESMSLDSIRKGYPEYYHMLAYYMEQYRKYAGSQSVAAFALVGDAGLANAGACKPLATCTMDDCVRYSGDTCIQCGENDDKWNTNDTTATDGAEHGLSYIHLARFLSTVYRDENGIMQTDGKEGGYASICSSNYAISVNSIFEDLTSRTSPIPLKGYPIPSTLRVAIIQDGKAVELNRDNAQNGWRYDALQNAVIVTGAQNIKDGANIALSYNIWVPAP